MAARSQHVQDNSVAERRLRPIYEWLDGGYNKKALQEAEKVLKKTPSLQCARALKALALLRLGKESDCITILDVLRNEKPCDDPTLQAMTICYRELHQFEKVCTLYETAIQIDSNNEELHTHLFMSYVRVLDFKSQQQAAMALYKLKPKNPYYFWAVMSIVLQASRGNANEDKKKLLLSLAERMVHKLINENKIEAEQEIQLYMMILKLQDKNEEALKLLESPLGSRLLTGATTHAKIPYLINLKRWSNLNILCKKMLIENLDLWDIWKHYLTSVFELVALKSCQVNNIKTSEHENNIGEELTPDDTIEKCHDFICTLMESCSVTGPTVRSPWLARIELYCRLEKNNSNPKELLGDFLELLVEYFRKFGHKPCCIFDMKIYLKYLHIDRRIELSSRLLKEVDISVTTLPQTEQQMQRHICSLQLSHLCGAHEKLSSDHLYAFVTALALHYQHGSNTYGTDLLSTEPSPSDPYVILSAHVLYKLSLREHSSSPILLALSLLEKLLKTSPSNHHAKLLCVRLYHILGAGYAAHLAYETLDVKHMQLDSLGHIHCSLLPSVGPPSIMMNLYAATSKFFSVNYKDTADHLTFSYKFGSFLKLEEFLDFRERLNNSQHRSWVVVEKVIAEIVQCNSLQAITNLDIWLKNETRDYENLRDNRDISVCVTYDPATLSDEADTENELVFNQDKNLIKLRSSLLFYVAAALEIPLLKEDSRPEMLQKLVKLEEIYNNIIENIKSCDLKTVRLNWLTGNFPSRLSQQIISPYTDVLCSFIKIVQHLVKSDSEASCLAITNSEKVFKTMSDDICNLIEKEKGASDCHINKREITEIILNGIEIISLSTLLCAGCCELSKPAQGKKGKKKGNVISAMWIQIQNLVTTMKDNIEMLDQVLQSWNIPIESPDTLTVHLGSLSLNEGTEQTVIGKLSTSHINLIKELHTMLKDKLKLLSVLKS